MPIWFEFWLEIVKSRLVESSDSTLRLLPVTSGITDSKEYLMGHEVTELVKAANPPEGY